MALAFGEFYGLVSRRNVVLGSAFVAFILVVVVVVVIVVVAFVILVVIAVVVVVDVIVVVNFMTRPKKQFLLQTQFSGKNTFFYSFKRNFRPEFWFGWWQET